MSDRVKHADASLRVLVGVAIESFSRALLAALPGVPPPILAAFFAEAAEREVTEWLVHNGVSAEHLERVAESLTLSPYDVEVLRTCAASDPSEFWTMNNKFRTMNNTGSERFEAALEKLSRLGLVDDGNDATDAGRARLRQLGVTW